MIWLEHHIQSEQFASDAEVSSHRGERAAAIELYAKAAEAEERALSELDPSKLRTYGIIAVSAVALHYKAAMSDKASVLAHRLLGSATPLPYFARRQLDDLLDSIKREQAGLDIADAHILVSMSGGRILPGGAPMDLVISKSQNMKHLLYRTTEHLKRLPHRRRGEPSKEIQDAYRPWIFQAAPGSYQFEVSVQETRQLSMFDTDDVHPKQIVVGLFDILRACAESPVNGLTEIVDDAEYRSTFLKLTRDLAPTTTGRIFSRIDIKSADRVHPISLIPSTRNAINDAIRANRSPVTEGTDEEVHGILRALHLDSDWIEVIGYDEIRYRIERVSEEVDDRIGSMVNRPIVVHATRVNERLYFRDIETDE